MAGALGIEPRNGGTKNRCLTAWLRPNTVENRGSGYTNIYWKGKPKRGPSAGPFAPERPENRGETPCGKHPKRTGTIFQKLLLWPYRLNKEFIRFLGRPRLAAAPVTAEKIRQP